MIGFSAHNQNISTNDALNFAHKGRIYTQFRNWHGPCKAFGIIGTVPITSFLSRWLDSLTKGIFAMNNFDFSAARSFVAAAAIALVSTTMLFAATAVPSVAAVSSSIA